MISRGKPIARNLWSVGELYQLITFTGLQIYTKKIRENADENPQKDFFTEFLKWEQHNEIMLNQNILKTILVVT